MTPPPTPFRLDVLIIVQADRPDLFPRLHEQFGRATILYDRRRGDRRQLNHPVATERRSTRDRREPLAEPEEQLWRVAGYRIVYRAGERAD